MSAQLPDISRRRFIVSAGFTAAALSLTPRQFFGAEQNLVAGARASGAKAKIATQALRGNVSALIGSGGNIAVLPGSDGKLIIDSGYLSSRTQIAEALAGVSGDPVKHLVNTHWHFDHTDGNEWMHSAGATITAHENTRKHLSTSTRVEGWNFTFPASPAGAIPTEVFNADKTLHFNGATVALKYYGPAHTDGDISIYFTEADVLHTGDTWWNGHYPFIDYSTGGSINGMIKAAEANLAMVTDKTIVIPGHGPVGGKAEMIVYRDILASIRDRVAALKGEGKSLNEIVAAKVTAAYDAKWGKGFVNGEFFTKLVYEGVG
ncbi:MAG TPA: MBL fold metallo-hydrolase [Candidatus Udaeobacter sp.]|nr:MBL fold metallo-hydrolase [Candidatus Udaeobacter sp.]